MRGILREMGMLVYMEMTSKDTSEEEGGKEEE